MIVGYGRLSLEAQRLYNPALLAILARRAVDAHFQQTGAGLPVTLTYVGVGMALHQEARKALTGRITTQLGTWVDRNPEVQIVLPKFLSGVSGHVTESLLWGLSVDLIRTSLPGAIIAGERSIRQGIVGSTKEVTDMQRAAAYVGRWFGVNGEEATVLRLLGVRP